MRETWIDRAGRVHEGDNHQQIAERLFPRAPDAERACEKLGYVKTGVMHNGSPMAMAERATTQAQDNALERLWNEHYNAEHERRPEKQEN